MLLLICYRRNKFNFLLVIISDKFLECPYFFALCSLFYNPPEFVDLYQISLDAFFLFSCPLDARKSILVIDVENFLNLTFQSLYPQGGEPVIK